jgi:alpha-galactosidase
VAGGEALVKKLEDGTVAVGLFNPGETLSTVAVTWTQAGVTGPQRVRDLWRQKDLGVFGEGFSAEVPRHGVTLVRLFPEERQGIAQNRMSFVSGLLTDR